MLKIGDKAPDFTLLSDSGRKFSLKSLKGHKIILYFYPKDDTSGCTKEACDFRDSIKTFENKETVILGISKDSIESHKNFKSKFNLPFFLLSDEEGQMVNDYGVWKEKNMYGKKYMGIERTTFLIDERGKIKEIWNNVKVPGHVQNIISKL
ncbi:MAG: thioredoxin-dependent thiol peroxidase [Candidatus Kapaibacterium sp.]